MRKNENKQERRNKGFTLVELIIVIAILAVIAAIAAPNLIGNISKSKKTADVANAKVIGDAAVVTMIEKVEYEAVAFTDFNLSTTPTVTGDLDAMDVEFIEAVKANIQGMPTPKSVASATSFTLSADGNGKITVKAGSQTLYPDSGYAK